jgi:hypothetical protein
VEWKFFWFVEAKCWKVAEWLDVGSLVKHSRSKADNGTLACQTNFIPSLAKSD